MHIAYWPEEILEDSGDVVSGAGVAAAAPRVTSLINQTTNGLVNDRLGLCSLTSLKCSEINVSLHHTIKLTGVIFRAYQY